MTVPVFSNFSCDYYVRRREMKRGAQSFTIYAECHRNELGANNNDYYMIDLYLSANGYLMRDFIVGVTFGKEPLDQKSIDMEMDKWIDKITNDAEYPFAMELSSYMASVKLLDDSKNSNPPKTLLEVMEEED